MARADARDLIWRQTQGDTFAPWCQSPVELQVIGLPDTVEALASDNRKLPAVMRVACRKCEGCAQHRQMLWGARGAAEIQAARRTWFLTLTVAPEHRFRLGLIAERRWLRPGKETLADLTPMETYRILVRILSEEVTRMLKRLRKSSGPFRYLCVFEAHKDGFPHVHLLVHENGAAITKRSIERQWPLGFTQVKLVDDGPEAAFYVAKYLGKEATTRIRASLRYGQVAHLLTEQLFEMCDAVSHASAERNGSPSQEE